MNITNYINRNYIKYNQYNSIRIYIKTYVSLIFNNKLHKNIYDYNLNFIIQTSMTNYKRTTKQRNNM